MFLDNWITPDDAELRIQRVGFTTELKRGNFAHQNHIHYWNDGGVDGRVYITGDSMVDERCILRIEERHGR